MEQLDLLSFAIATLESLNIPYMVVGSYASGAYGDPRFTRDIDIVVQLAANDVEKLIERLPPSEFYISREAALVAVASGGQFNVIHPESAGKIDFMIARSDAWGQEQLRRRQRIELLTGLHAFTARPEDVIIAKLMFYQEGGSEKHMRDITSMFGVSGNEIDRAYIERWVQQLGLTSEWDSVLARI
ncbi:MAG: hypothetical protein QOF78_2484 [Phycisphaerales bacterium]|nr:hypothetical protein [Phycisphaerales bacterium]